ncbi:MAG TPA: ABC transporter ATP-binding protein [Pyrinomonadaceae bacterium]|nr:ABC transporter ATP-binding protein [Pyrinomonadaceae bacterium]
MINVRQLIKTYNETEALRSISFSVPAGQVCGLLGPNGAGKSTTVKILTGALRPTSGEASVAGFDCVHDSLEVKKRIGYVPETGTVYSTLSAHEYLALCGALHEMEPEDVAERSRRMLELFQIKEAADRRLDTLSKGMRQKVVISAALLHDPEVVLFDEPLSGLDANAALLIKDIVRGLADRGKTILYCSHILDVVERLCERVIILDRGEIVADGMTAELLSTSRRDTLETLFRSLTATEDNKELVGAFLGSLGTERADREVEVAQLDGKQEKKSR